MCECACLDACACACVCVRARARTCVHACMFVCLFFRGVCRISQASISRLGQALLMLLGTSLQEGIDSEALAALDDAQLKELGVKRMGDRTKVTCPACSPASVPFSILRCPLHCDSAELTVLAVAAQLRAKAMGIALPAPFASPPGHRPSAPQQSENGPVVGGGNIPEHLQVLKRMTAASNSPNGANGHRPRVRTTVDDLAEKISATNFVLAGAWLLKFVTLSISCYMREANAPIGVSKNILAHRQPSRSTDRLPCCHKSPHRPLSPISAPVPSGAKFSASTRRVEGRRSEFCPRGFVRWKIVSGLLETTPRLSHVTAGLVEAPRVFWTAQDSVICPWVGRSYWETRM